jgi:hypothetical protein
MNLKNNTILITGGGTGIGLGLALAFHVQGNKVIITGRRKEVLQEASDKTHGIDFFEMDIDDPSSIQETAAAATEKYPALNVVINNAGMYLHAERLLAKAGVSKAQGEGVSPPLERRQSWSGKGEAKRRSAQAKRGRFGEAPCAGRSGSAPERGLSSLFACVSTHEFSRVALRQEQVAEILSRSTSYFFLFRGAERGYFSLQERAASS